MNISQCRLAKSVGVDARRIHAIVNGEREDIGDDGAAVLAVHRELGRVLEGAAKPVLFRDSGGGSETFKPVAAHLDTSLELVVPETPAL